MTAPSHRRPPPQLFRSRGPLLLILLSFWLLAGCTPPRHAANANRAVVFAGRLSRQHLPSDGNTLLYAQLRIGPGDIPAPEHSNVNLALVIDSSGSMEGEGLARAKEAAARMVAAMADGDRLALVTFDTEVQVLIPSTRIDEEERAKAVAMVEHMRAKGTTNMFAGLEAGLAEVQRHFDAEGINGIVLLGDGIPNDATGIEDLAQRAGQQQVRITSLGLGIDYNEALMADIAQRSGGRFHYVDEPEKVADYFHDEILRMHRVYAKNMQLELVLGPEVDHELLGHEVGTAQSVIVPLGDLSHRESIDVMLRLDVPGRRAGAAIEILDAKLSYEVPSADDEHAEQRVYLSAHATDDETELAAIDRKLEHAGVMAEAAHATLTAVAKARGGAKAEAEQAIDFAIERLDAQAKHGEKKALAARVAELRVLRKTLPEPQPISEASVSAEALDDMAEEEQEPPPSPAEQRQMKSSHDAAVQSFSPR
jgi:Ca-activated chloride channel family protein